MNVKEDLKELQIPTDSLERIEMVMDLEDKYDIILSDTELAEVNNKDELVALIESK
jgi:acyl carrier protein